MDISIYFEKIELAKILDTEQLSPKHLGSVIIKNTTETGFPDFTGMQLALLGITESRAAINNTNCAQAPDQIRSFLYLLFSPENDVNIIDLGNIKPGNSLNDTYFAVRDVVSTLLKNNIIPVILGGGQDLTYANYLAYESLGKIINIVSVDNGFDLGVPDQPINSKSYLNKIITHQPSFLFNYSNIGYQSYFVDSEAVELMKNLYFDVYRLGVVQSDLEEVEPMVRNADMISVDISCVRMSDAPGNGNASPNGFYGEELCQIMRYAGLSDKLSTIGIYEVNPALDRNGQTAHLAAQALWYFIDGFSIRKSDHPLKEKKHYLKYRVIIKSSQNEIVFYKSKKSDRWWMEVPCPAKLMQKYERHYLVPCSYEDYQTAMKDEIPDRWWQAYQKIM